MKNVFGVFVLVILGQPVIAQTGYQGSSFNEVMSVIRDLEIRPANREEQAELKVYKDRLLPQYKVNASTVFEASIPLERDAKRTIDEKFDYYDRLKKKLHPNGVCVAGEWAITQPTKYSGYFKNGSKALFVGRISVAMEETTQGNKRGFGLAGKLFPTMNPDEVVETANFFTVDVLMGTRKDNFLDTSMTNEPAVGFDLSAIGLGLKIASALKSGDENPSFRPVSPISKLGLTRSERVVTPKWIRVTPFKSLTRVQQADFRNEVLVALQKNGKLLFKVEVSDSTKEADSDRGWTPVGLIHITEADVTYGCDRRLHFAHPKLSD